MTLETRPWLLNFQAAAAPQEFSIFFPGYEVWSSCPWFVCGISSFWSECGAVLTIFFSLADPPSQCRARVRVITPPSEAQDSRFFVVVQIRPSDALLSPEPGGEQGTLFTHNVVQGYIRVCVSIFIFLCCICFTFFG